MTPQTFLTITVLALAPVALAQSDTDELKQRILAQAQSMSADDYAFARTFRTDQSTGGAPERKVTVEKFDPTRQGDARWTLVSINGAPPSPDELKEFQKDAAKRRVPGYYRLATYFGSAASATTDGRGRPTFRFAGLPKGTVMVFDTDVSQNATVEAAVNTSGAVPFVEQVHVSVAPMRLKVIMKLESFESTAHYRLGPEGKPFLAEQVSDTAASGMGKQGKVHTVTTYSDFRAVNARH